MTLYEYIGLLRRRWWLVLLCLALGGAGAYAAAQSQTKVYGSTLTFFISDAAGRPVAGLPTETVQGLFASYATLVQSSPVTTQVQKTTEVKPAFFNASGGGIAGTVFLSLSVESDSPENALAMARAYADVLPDYVRNFQGGNATLAVFDGPDTSATPLSPNVNRDVLTGLALGLVLGVVATLVLNSMDTRLRTGAALEEATGLSVLATIPREHRGRSLLIQSHPRSLRAEAVRQVRANLQFAALDMPLQVLVVTSAVPSEGKTSVAADLALACAEAGRTVVLVDADLRKPRLAEVFDRAATPGLTDVLVGNSTLEDCLAPHSGADLQILTSGTLPARPSELLGSQAMADLIERLAERAELVIIDSAPLLPVADTASLLAHVDAVLLVSRLDHTTRKQVRSSVERLRSFQARVVGVVANGGRTATSDGYYLTTKSRFSLRRRPPEYVPPPSEVAAGTPLHGAIPPVEIEAAEEAPSARVVG